MLRFVRLMIEGLRGRAMWGVARVSSGFYALCLERGLAGGSSGAACTKARMSAPNTDHFSAARVAAPNITSALKRARVYRPAHTGREAFAGYVFELEKTSSPP